MKKLNVYVGPDPINLVPYHLGHPITIKGPFFEGEICVFIEPPNATPVRPGQPRKKFSIQTVGKYTYGSKETYQPTFDDVMFGVEFDRPVNWNSLPVPKWLAKLCFNWLTRLNDDLDIQNIFHDTSQYERLGSSSSIEWKRLFSPGSRDKPSILSPIVCASSTMNILPSHNDQENKIMVNGEYDSLQTTGVNGKNIQVSKKSYEFARVEGEESLEDTRRSELIHSPRSFWISNTHHRFPREIKEFNSFIFTDCATVDYDRTAHDRRLFLRGKQKNTQGLDFHHPLMRGVPPGPLRGIESRRMFEFKEKYSYGFEFFADYFDFLNFELCPKLSSTASASSPPTNHSLLNLLSGRWRFNVGSYIKTRVNSDGTSVSVLRIVCKVRSTNRYFWCIEFEYIE